MIARRKSDVSAPVFRSAYDEASSARVELTVESKPAYPI